MLKHIVIFSHGFAVRSDARGMFTEIADALSPGTEKVMFDYNQWDETTRTLTSGTMDEWVEKLRHMITETRANNPDAIIDLVCHSQGCLAAALAKPTGLRKIVLLGPPAVLTPERMIDTFERLTGVRMKVDETSRLPRRDGSTTIVPPEYWQSIRNLDPVALFNGLADLAKVVAINAGADEVVDNPVLDDRIKQTTIPGADHNFTDAARPRLIHEIQGEFARIPIVDKHDNIITHKFHDEVLDDDIYRVSALWLKNSKGEILLAQRTHGKHHDPSRWQGAVAGTVEEGETYLDNIIKETREEIGVDNLQLTPTQKHLMTNDYKFFVQFFTATLDKPAEEFAIAKDEVIQVRWFKRDELARELHEHPEHFTSGVAWALENL